MEHFPHLNLGHTQLCVSVAIFLITFAFFLVLVIYFYVKHKLNLKVLLFFFAVAIILTAILGFWLDITVGNKVFKEIHFRNSREMPEPAECLEYKPTFSYLHARYKVKPDILKKWVGKYKLKESPKNTFISKVAPNGQHIKAVYNLETQILTIDYKAF